MMDRRKNSRRSGRRMEPNKKHLEVSGKYSESLIALNESSFKIRRFMNDVSTYKGNASSKNKQKTRHESESKDNENTDPKSSLVAKKANNKLESKGKRDTESRATFAFQAKKGLFENGVATRTRNYCRGLMPPMWNARLNADLRSILNLAGVDTKKKHAPSTSIAEPIDHVADSLRSRSSEATLINSQLATKTGKKTTLSKKSKEQLRSISNYDDSLVGASCSQVGSTEREPVPESGSLVDDVLGGAEADDVPDAAAKSDVDNGVNYSDYYLRFTHSIIKSLSSTRIDRDELESGSKETVRFLAEFYRERLAQAREEQDLGESPPHLAKDVFQSPKNVRRSQPTGSLPAQSCANTIRSDEWPRISRMKAQADEQFCNDSVVRKGKVYTSGLKLLEAVYGQNNLNQCHKTFDNLSVTPQIFSPIAEDTCSNSGQNFSFLNPVSGKRDCLPDFRSYSPPEMKSCDDYRSAYCSKLNDLNFINCGNDCNNPCNRSVMNCDLMTVGDDYANPSTSMQYRPGLSGRSCFLNNNSMTNDNGRIGKTFNILDRHNGKDNPATTTVDCVTILPPKSRGLAQWKTLPRGSYGVKSKFGINDDESADDRNALLTLPLRPPARESPNIHYYPRRMF